MSKRENQKDLVKALIRDARIAWEHENSDNQAIEVEIDYENKMSGFYRHLQEVTLPKWAKTGKEEYFLEAMQEYAREDWIATGFSAESFDKKLKDQKSLARKVALIGSITFILGVAIKVLANALPEALSRYFPTQTFIIGIIIIAVIVAIYVYINQKGDSEIISLKKK